MYSSRFTLALALALGLRTTAILGQGSASPSATAYLQQAADRFQHTIDVYTDSDAAGNHFAARGEFDAVKGNLVVPMDEISAGAPCLGITCITATFDSRVVNWGGWYFLNGVLGPTDRQPSSNWGDQPNSGYDLTGATSLRFWARGAVGGEKVHFFAFGVGNTDTPNESYPDSSTKAKLPQDPVVLTTTWTQYEIPLSGKDLSYVLGGFGWMADKSDLSALQPSIQFYLDNIQYVKEHSTDPHLIVSYEAIKSSNAFDQVVRNTAFTYDNAVALIALTKAGDLGRARQVADALLYSLSHDRFFNDGRLRNGYQGGEIWLPSGWLPYNKPNTARMPGWYDANHATWFEDATQVSTNTGNIGWAMLGLIYYYQATHQRQYLRAADTLGDWVLAKTLDTRGNGGFTGGFDGWENDAAARSTTSCGDNAIVNGQCKRFYKSTEHNIDLYSAFSQLYALERLEKWRQAAQQAKTFFLSMWDQVEGKFWTGTGEDGVTTSTSVIPLDIQAWAIQALGSESQPYWRALEYVERHHKTALGYGFKQNGGNTCGDHTWFEGTSQVALSYLLAGNVSKWQSIINGIHSAQQITGAVPASDGTDETCVNTGFKLNDDQPWIYYHRAHLGATAWLSLAEQNANPFNSVVYSASPSISFTYVPPVGDKSDQLEGAVSRPFSDYAIAVYIRVNGGWWTKPYSNTPVTMIQADGSWTCPIVTGGIDEQATVIAAFLISKTYNPPLMSGGPSLPAELMSNALASTQVNRSQNGIAGRVSDAVGNPISGLTVSLTGSITGNTQTSTDGKYSFPTLSGSGPYTVTPSNSFYSLSPQKQAFASVTGTQIADFSAVSASALRFVPVAPCRVVDTRSPDGQFGGPTLRGGVTRDFSISSSTCGIPVTAQAYALNVTVVPSGGLDYLTIWAGGQPMPIVSTLNSTDGRIKANAAIVPAGASGSISVYPTGKTDLVLDISGYFVSPAVDNSALAFYPLTPCRVADTRGSVGPLGGPALSSHTTRDFPILLSACGIPSNARSYSANFTVVPKTRIVEYLSTWPAGQSQPLVSTLNDLSGTVVANAAIVPAGTNGDISVFVTDASELIIDVNGYFAPPASGGLSLYPVTPCRVLDTRLPSGSQPFNGTKNVDVAQSSCNYPDAQAYVLNATVVPAGVFGYLTLWPMNRMQPLVSTLNAWDGFVTSNMAVVPAASGSINAFVTDTTHLLLDVSGYFAP